MPSFKFKFPHTVWAEWPQQPSQAPQQSLNINHSDALSNVPPSNGPSLLSRATRGTAGTGPGPRVSSGSALNGPGHGERGGGPGRRRQRYWHHDAPRKHGGVPPHRQWTRLAPADSRLRVRHVTRPRTQTSAHALPYGARSPRRRRSTVPTLVNFRRPPLPACSLSESLASRRARVRRPGRDRQPVMTKSCFREPVMPVPGRAGWTVIDQSESDRMGLWYTCTCLEREARITQGWNNQNSLNTYKF